MFILFAKLCAANLTALNGLWLRNEKQGVWPLKHRNTEGFPFWKKAATNKYNYIFRASLFQWQHYMTAKNKFVLISGKATKSDVITTLKLPLKLSFSKDFNGKTIEAELAIRTSKFYAFANFWEGREVRACGGTHAAEG